MKNKYFIRFTIIGVLICTVIYYLFLLLGINLLLTAVAWFIPVGGTFFGAIIGFLARIGIEKDKTECGEAKQGLFALFLFAFLFSLTLFEYATCYISEGGEISRFFIGEHVSKAIPDLNFGKYFVMRYVEAETTVSYRYNTDYSASLGDTGFTFIIYFLQYLASIITGVSPLSIKLDKSDNAEKEY